MTEAFSPREPRPRGRPRKYPELGRLIHAARMEAAMTQEELARRVGISNGYVPRIENGRARPHPDILRLIAAATHSDPTDLLVAAGYVRPAEAALEKEDGDLRLFRHLPEHIRKILLKVGSAMVLQEEADDLEQRRRRARRGPSERAASEEQEQQG